MTEVRRGGRAVTLLNGAAAAGLIAVLAAVALVVNPPSPPGIAEFAPQAAKPITKAPLGQAATAGHGPAACLIGSKCGAPTPSPTAIPTALTASAKPTGVPSALQCYSWPDGSVTQTFDPQSPPCVATWPEAAKGNGGATSHGVTGTAIRIAWPTNGIVAPNSPPTGVTPWATFFNSHFQLYGRKIVIVPVKASSASASDQHAAAVDTADQDVFASLDLTATKGTPGPEFPFFSNDLAKQSVISVAGGGGFTSETAYAGHHPYEWAYLPTQDALQRATGSLVCSQLAGHPASHSSTYATTTRTFAILTYATGEGEPAIPTDGYRQALARCGVTARVYEASQTPGTQNTATFTQLNGAGVTTLLTINEANGTGGTSQLMQDAARSGYFPEWVVPGGPGDEDEYRWGGAPTAETRGLFGIAGWNRGVDTITTPARQAFGAPWPQAADPSFYDQLQILAAGIQAAGPHLTPQTFAIGLQGLSYPNPGAGGLPDYQARVGFSGDHVAVDDLALVWWDGNATSRQDLAPGSPHNPGAWCYEANGARWPNGRFPRQDRVGSRSGALC